MINIYNFVNEFIFNSLEFNESENKCIIEFNDESEINSLKEYLNSEYDSDEYELIQVSELKYELIISGLYSDENEYIDELKSEINEYEKLYDKLFSEIGEYDEF